MVTKLPLNLKKKNVYGYLLKYSFSYLKVFMVILMPKYGGLYSYGPPVAAPAKKS